MNQKQIIKIARKIFALNAQDLRRLQEKYDEEVGIFEDSISDFEDLADSIDVNELGKKDRSIIEKLFKDYDPKKIETKIITYLAGGLYVKVLKMTNELVHADDNVDDILSEIQGGLSSLSKEQLKTLYKESKKEKKVLAKIARGLSDKIIALIDKIIARAEGFENNFKGDKALSALSKSEVMEQKMEEIIDSLQDAKAAVEDYSIDDVEEKIQALEEGMEEIKALLKGEGGKGDEIGDKEMTTQETKSESDKKEEQVPANLEEKINSLDGDDLFDAGSTIQSLNNFKISVSGGIDNDIKPQINVGLIKTVTGVQESEINQVINMVLHNDKDSIEQKVVSTMDEMVSLLYNKKIKEFYNKLKEINEKPGSYFKGAAYNNIYSYFDNNKELKDMLQNAFKRYNIKEIMEIITETFEQQVNNYKPMSLRVTRTSSINQIARRITASYCK